ncbi:heat shock 70 kDa protein 12A-like [Mytilus galloprovincialis]|uniref:heat shock 70 kDa protein 12A-like n=1 Tax=Mytilus galloprovincialis TaxID=29158 RepID=UPI003F7C0BB7
MSSKKSKILVAAIDFGTTFSGYAFSFKTDYENDPMKISVNQQWTAGSRSLISLKAPTVVLLDKSKQFLAFGYDAEDKYSEFALDEVHHNFYYFRRFKMLLHETKHLTRKTMIKDDDGKEMPALEIFSMVIKYLKGHLLETLETRGTGLDNNDIHWVLTVPAIWTEPAKQFMREAAEKAGISGEQLSICLEPEAASLYCQHLPIEKLKDKDGIGSEFTASGRGAKYMVLDLGGGTADITCHQKDAEGSLRELQKPSGGSWGGTRVDEAFNQLLIKIVGAHHFRTFQEKNKADALDIYREMETKKRNITNDTEGKVTLKVPVSLIQSFEKETGEEIKEVIKQMAYAGKMTWVGDKLRMDANLFRALFNDPKTNLVNHVKSLMTKGPLRDVSTILMVGGFSESPIMQSAIKDAFPGKKVVVPDEAGLAVLKGAVMYGHQPQTISVRISRYTYGINISPPFKSGEHSPERRVSIEGTDRVKDVFKKYIEADQTLKVGEAVSGRHVTIKKRQKEMLLKIFATEDSNPRYVTDKGCEYLGKVVIQLPEVDEKLKVDVKMIFGETELMVEAKESTTGSTYKSFFDFL